MAKWKFAPLFGCFLYAVLCQKAFAQDALADWNSTTNDPNLRVVVSDTQPGCSENLKVVNDLAAYAAVSSYRGVTQTAQQVVYSRSTCFDERHLDRWKVDLGVSHIAGGGFSSESASFGLGGEFHPFKKAPAFSITPVARIGYDDFNGAGHQLSWGGELTTQYILEVDKPLKITLPVAQGNADSPKQIYSPGRQIILAARGAYQRQSASLATAPNQIDRYDRLTAFGMIGLDSHFKDRHLRWQTLLSYQSLDGGLIRGYGSVEISLRKLSNDYQNYRRVYKIIGNFAHNYQAVIFSVDFRF